MPDRASNVRLLSVILQREKHTKPGQKGAAPGVNSPHPSLPASPAAAVTSSADAVGAAPAQKAEGGGSSTIAHITARARDPRFGRVVIFPEGTCGNGEAVLQVREELLESVDHRQSAMLQVKEMRDG
jgi:hypothetical protein